MSPLLTLLMGLACSAVGVWLTWFAPEPLRSDLARMGPHYGPGFLLLGCSLIIGALLLWLIERR
jgi:hypothetical protein